MSVHYSRGILLYERKNYKSAITEFRQALQEDPDDEPALRFLAMSLSLEGQNKEAIREIKTLLKKCPNDPDVLHVAALIHFNDKRETDAEKFIKASLALDPKHAYNHVILSYIAERREKWKQMHDHAKTALELEPENIEALIALSRALTELSERKEARKALESALALEPNNALAHANLGSLLLDLGDRQGAREHLRESLRLDPNCRAALDGFIESLRAKNILYFWFISFIWALTRGPAGFIYRFRIGPPGLLFFVLVFWYFVWIVKELATLSLRFDKEVRHYLPPEFKRRNTRNLILIAGFFTLVYGSSAYSAHQADVETKTLKQLMNGGDPVKASTLEDELFKRAYEDFTTSSFFYFNNDQLNLIYDYELKRKPQDKYRIALAVLWLGMNQRGQVMKGDECIYFRQALKLALELGDKNLANYALKQIDYSLEKTNDNPGKPKWLEKTH